MSLLEELLAGPSAADQYLSMAPMLGGVGGAPQMGPSQHSGMGGGSVEDQARQYFLSHGYTPKDFGKVNSIIGRESSWDPHAVNPSSGAAGIAQNINGFSQGYSRNDPQEQIRWLFNYLGNHNYEGYGTGIDAALAHKNATGWY